MKKISMEEIIKLYNKNKKISGHVVIDSQLIAFDYEENKGEKNGIPMDIESLLIVADKIYINK